VVRFLAYTGLRWGELAALRVRDVDPLRRRMLIARSVTEDNGRLIFDTTKTGEERTVPLPRFLAEQVTRPRLGRAPMIWCSKAPAAVCCATATSTGAPSDPPPSPSVSRG